MAYERRRLSTESDKSSTSTTHSTESNGTYSTLSPSLVHPTIPTDQKLSILTTRKTSHLAKRNSAMTSPAEQILARTKNTFVDLNPYFQCSSLPNHWRKNKSLRFVLRAKTHIDIKPNTRVIVLAGNDYNPCATLKNNVSWFRDGQAEFNDLRFLGASGRGKKFTLTVIIETSPPQQCTYRRAIKITVDGPRKKRELKAKSDVNETQGDESNMDGESDNETTTPSNAMATETSASLSQGSSGLDLLAAVAEQKSKDEAENIHRPSERSHDGPRKLPNPSDPVRILYPSKSIDPKSPMDQCISPTLSLISQFSQSVAFSPTSSADNFQSRSTRHPFLPNSNSSPTSTTTVPLMSNMTSSNLRLSFPPRFDLYHSQARRDQQNIVETSTASSSSNAPASTHVLCR